MTGPHLKLLQRKLASTIDTSNSFDTFHQWCPGVACINACNDVSLPFQAVYAFTTHHQELQACSQHSRLQGASFSWRLSPRMIPQPEKSSELQGHAQLHFTSKQFKSKRVLMKITIATNQFICPLF